MGNLSVIVFQFMMQKSLKYISICTAIAVVVAVLVSLLSMNRLWVETIYSTHWYPSVASALRRITGRVPFSMGDLLYILAMIYVLKSIVKGIVKVCRRQVDRWDFLKRLLIIVRKLAVLYVVFMLLWGLNYSRLGVTYQLKLHTGNYSTEELTALTGDLLQKVNTTRRVLGEGPIHCPSYDTLFRQATDAYATASAQYPFFTYHPASIKRSLFSGGLTYLGYTGYYNPFTGEAQVNAVVPPFYLPYTTCHEMAHQLGYGDESEANFIGYLTAKASDQPLFHYSAYYDLFRYANNELYMRDSAAARKNYQALDTLVKQDMRAARKFFSHYKSRMEPIVSFLYGQYLKANHQPQGIDTYDAVTDWLIAYRRRYGSL